mgnify:CR=1 FL=1
MKISNICKKISHSLGIDPELARRIVLYQFKFTSEVMKDPDDYHDILLNKFLRFSLKPRYKNDKNKEYSSK